MERSPAGQMPKATELGMVHRSAQRRFASLIPVVIHVSQLNV